MNPRHPHRAAIRRRPLRLLPWGMALWGALACAGMLAAKPGGESLAELPCPPLELPLIAPAATAAGPLAAPSTVPATASMANAPGKAPKLEARVAKARRIPVVHYEKLISHLPPVPDGWQADKASGCTTPVEDFTVSNAARTYVKTGVPDVDTAPVATVTILDAAGHKGYFESLTGQWKFDSERPDGYDKVGELDGQPFYEHCDRGAQSCSLALIVAGRFFVQIELLRLPPAELRVWLKRIDLKALAALAPPAAPAANAGLAEPPQR